MAKENRPMMRRTKGWIGYVRSFNEYCDNGNYDDIDWSDKPETKSVVTDHMGKKIYKF